MKDHKPFKKSVGCFIALMFAACLVVVAESAEKEKPKYDKVFPAGKTYKASTPNASVDSLTIGIILPLAAKDTASGRTLDAILLGSGVFDRGGNSPFTLMVEYTPNSREMAEKAVSKLSDEDGVICIISLLNGLVDEAAAREAQRLKIPILTLTPKKDITAIGDYVFRNFPTDKMQITCLVKYAIESLNSRRFAILYPDNPYGQGMKDLFRDDVLRLGGKLFKTQSYNASQKDFTVSINALTDQEKTLIESQGESSMHKMPFDTLFIPDSYVNIKAVASQSAFQKIKGIQLLGTNAWQHRDLLKAGSDNLEGAVFVDGFFLNSFYAEVNDFTDGYYAAFEREPDMMDAIAFDAIKIVTGILGGGRRNDTRETFRKELLNVKDYSGVTGRTSFSQQRDAEKEAFVLKVSRGQIVQVK